MMTSDDAARVEDARQQDARQRSLQIAAAEEPADRAVEDHTDASPDLSPDAEIASAIRSGRQHDRDDTAAYASTRPLRHSGPGR